MALFDFLDKNIKRLAHLTAGNIDDLIDRRFEEINQCLRRIEAMHKETSIQLEEIESFLQGDNDESIYISALIELSDIIEDFYNYASCDKDSPLFEQAQMMWNTAKNKTEKAGLTLIESEEEPFDFTIHTIKNTSYDENLPAGYVIKTLKCGYVFKDEVIRHAAVIVNARNAQEQETAKEEMLYNESGN